MNFNSDKIARRRLPIRCRWDNRREPPMQQLLFKADLVYIVIVLQVQKQA